MLVAVRSAASLYRLLDVLPVFEGDGRIAVRFTLVPGSAFDVDALAALERSGARTLSWAQALGRKHDLILGAAPKGELRSLSGPRVVLPHGAGFNKALPQEGSPLLPSGLDPHYLLPGGEPLADLHVLAHDEQLARLAAHCPPAAARAAVVGDPTLDRLTASLPRREDYRRALGTGPRRLVVLTSTWGPESLLARRPELAVELAQGLPHDAYQPALVVHPNEYSRSGPFELTRRLAPALAAGLVLARPHEEWAALLVAADAVVTDHGSTALYAAALGRPVIGAYDGGRELIPGSPLAELLARAPRLHPGAGAKGLVAALEAAGQLDAGEFAHRAFARQPALPRLREELYRLLGLPPGRTPVAARPLPAPRTPSRPAAAFAVRAEVAGVRVAITRFPAAGPEPAHHLAAEHPPADPRLLHSAAVLWRRARPAAAPHASGWTAAGWTAHVFAQAPGCRTAAAVLDAGRVLVRHRSAGLLSVRVAPSLVEGRVLRCDPAAAVSAVHAWLAAGGRTPEAADWVSLVCEVGGLRVGVEVGRAREADLDYEV
ncbi:translation initiation factor 2 [Streptomyces polyrhachis]|uniref:Translation initiation factor 2 n=1 Tax=Streptomyces polyrhachis TaxID=1282885 RepID=A0ABW2GHS4_9ACTN